MTSFWSNVDTSDDDACWQWQGKTTTNGYAKYFSAPSGWSRLGHRVAWRLANEEELNSRVVHHTCGNKKCVNPKHLEAMTHSEHGRLHP